MKNIDKKLLQEQIVESYGKDFNVYQFVKQYQAHPVLP